MMKKICCIRSFILLFLITVTIFGQNMSVPANLQAALFKKIFAFDNNLKAKGDYEVAVLVNEGSGSDILSAFKQMGIKARLVNGNQVPNDVSVVYLMPDVKGVASVTASKKILSISGVPELVEKGEVSIGIGEEGGKPKIIINMNQLKAEGHELSAALLNIARIIQ